MKNKLFIFIPIFLFVLVLTFSGCNSEPTNSEPTYTADEWEQIQEEEEYYEIRQKLIEFDNNYWIIADKFNEEFNNIIDDLKYFENNKSKIISLIEDMIELINNFKEEFQKIYIPEPLDEFYYLKIEKINYQLKIFRSALSFYKTGSGGAEEVKEYIEKKDRFGLEADKEKRRVYREYGLDELIYKNQE